MQTVTSGPDGAEAPAVDAGTIDWLAPEVAKSFEAAEAALRAFRDAAAGVVDFGPLRIARSHLHQAGGALQVVELPGVARMIEAIEDLVSGFETAPARCDDAALAAIAAGCRAVLEYLEDLRVGGAPKPLHLFPTYRDVLAAGASGRIHPADLFQADLSVRPRVEPGAALDLRGLADQRVAFEQALLRFMRNHRDEKAIAALLAATAAIEGSVAATSKHAQQRAFWWVARAFFEALAGGGLAESDAGEADLKRLAGRVNLQIRQLVDGVPAIAERLFVDTLFFVALAEPVSPQIRAVQAAYRLANTVPRDFERRRYGLVDPALLDRAREVLSDAKSSWAAVVAGDIGEIRAFARATAALVEAVAPFGRRGLVDVAQIVDGIATDLGFDPRRPPQNVGLDVATALLFVDGALERARSLDDEFDARAAAVVARVEAAALGHDAVPDAADPDSADSVQWLDRLSREAEERLTMTTFVGELQVNLRHAEKILDAFFREPAVRDGLDDAAATLRQVAGALALLGHLDAHRAVEVSRETVDRLRTDDEHVDAAVFARVAGNLGAVGFYVEQLKRGRVDADAFAFDAATGTFSAQVARAPVATEARVEPAPHAGATREPDDEPALALDFGEVPESGSSGAAFADTEVSGDEPTFEERTARRSDEATLLAGELSLRPDDVSTRARLVAVLEDVHRGASLIDDRALQVEAGDALAAVRAAGRDGLSVEAAEALTARVAELAQRAQRGPGASAAPPIEPSAPVPEAGDTAAVDAELLEIFLEEAKLVLSDIGGSLHALDADPANLTAMTVVRRGFHTLKGSSRMVGLTTFGDAAWAVEETLNEFLADQIPAPTDLRALVDYAIRYLGDWVDDLASSGRSTRQPDALIEAARALRAGARAPLAPRLVAIAAPDVAEPPPAADAAADGQAAIVEPEDDFAKTVFLPPGTTPIEPAEDGTTPFDATRFEATRFEATQLEPAFAATQFIGGADDDDALPEIEFFGDQPALPDQATHVLEALADGEAEEADAPLGAPAIPSPTLSPAESDDFAKTVFIGDREDADDPLATFDASLDDAPFADEPVASPAASAEPEVRDDVRRIGPVTLSVALFNIYLGEADELLRTLTADFADWRQAPERAVSEPAMRAAHSLAGSSATVGLAPVHDLAAAVEEILLQLWREPVPLEPSQVDALEQSVEAMERMLHRFAAERMPEDEGTRVAALRALLDDIRRSAAAAATAAPVAHEAPGADESPITVESAEPFEGSVETRVAEEASVETAAPDESGGGIGSSPEEAPGVVADAAEAVPPEPLVAPARPPEARADESADALLATDLRLAPEAFVDVALPTPAAVAAPAEVAELHDEIDPDLLEVFIAEGNEIFPQVAAQLRAWQQDHQAPDAARLLLRHLHTLKGSARMAGAMRLGEAVHDFENRVESTSTLHDVPPALVEEMLAAHDRALELFEALGRPDDAKPAASAQGAPVEGVAPVEAGPQPDRGTTAEPRARDAQPERQAAVRVAGGTLDRLVNLAGEVSIARARIENEVSQVRGSLSELAENVERLRGQLREIELQAEFQMQSRMQSQSHAADSGQFDPLEFDRFTRFQELTRMMAESVNDVKTLQQNLQKNLETADIDLASQRRMTRDLQQDLMRVRMVPFANVSERLYRVARRAAKEVDKRVNLDIVGGNVEIDRGVLERMAGPFEHLLRNHIVHGIESRAARRDAGKDETGELLVEVRQEGNEIVLAFSDDGAGIDHERIRAKALALGLVGDGEIVSDAAAAEFIFHPGFSTADTVTELAGRGVGMDVVRAEAAALGGRVAVDSEPGRGTRFTITLPLTLAVTQVVLVSVAGRLFALPAALVEQVRQLRPQPLADAYRAGTVDREGEAVRLAFLGSLLQIEDSVPVAQRSSPVLMVRSSGESLALHVDEVVANQEAVVKGLGPQLARMSGIAGATVLGSGEIVLIINPVQIANAFAMPQRAIAIAPKLADDGDGDGALQTLPTVMVVDDSLTVRRVTQRLLSREGYQVVLAKDGVDALERLQEYAPDAMLVDIEMPRMDGFDLTRHVRGDERLKHIPIIMITSRTADKHRQHATALGVDEYLGKPYQEDDLLDLLKRYIAERQTA